jgi:hypothetical protein
MVWLDGAMLRARDWRERCAMLQLREEGRGFALEAVAPVYVAEA